MEIDHALGRIRSAVVVYLVATMGPGPANPAIMTAAMRFGRSAGMWLATGVLIDSLFWGLLAAADLSIMIMAYRGIAAGIMMFGGFYLAFLSYRALRSF